MLWRSVTVKRVLAVSQRELDYWEEVGLFKATGNKKRRRKRNQGGRLEQREYEFTDVLAVKLIKQLRDAGLSLQKVRKAAVELRRAGKVLSEVLLVTDGKHVEWTRGDGTIQRLLSGGQMVFAAVAIKRMEEELRRDLDADKHGRPRTKAS